MVQPVRFINIRVRQIAREFLSLGFFYGLVVIIGVCITFFLTYFSVVAYKDAIVAFILLYSVIFSIHINRSDRNFIECNAEQPYLVYLLEYCVFISPFLFIFIISLASWFPLVFYLPIILISIIKYRVNRKFFNNLSIKFINSHNYEWLSGIRKTGWIILILLTGSLLLAPVIFAPLVLLWFTLFIIGSFYEQHEPLEMLESYELPASGVLKKKISSQIGVISVPFTLILGLSALIHYERWWIYLLFLIYAMLMMAVFIVTKYSLWGVPGNHKAANITNALCLIGFFIPFLLPLPLILLVINYRKSINRLEPVLHDYNR